MKAILSAHKSCLLKLGELCKKETSTAHIFLFLFFFLISSCSLNSNEVNHHLNLSYRGLTTVPSEIFTRTDITKLNLSGNKITVLPPEIGNLKNLRHLNLYNNNLKSLPSEIGNLKNLESIFLLCNNLTMLPPEIGNLKNLESMFLSCNNLTTLPSEFGKLENLKTLDLSDNQFETILPAIEKLLNLENLYLQGSICVFLTNDIREPKNLEALSPLGNRLSTKELKKLFKMYPKIIFTWPREGATVDKRPLSLIRIEAKNEDCWQIIQTLLRKIPDQKMTFHDFIKWENEQGLKSIDEQIEFRLEFINFLLEKIEKQEPEGGSK